MLSEVKSVAKKSRNRCIYVKDKKKLNSILMRSVKSMSSYFFVSTGFLSKYPFFTGLFSALSGKIFFPFLLESSLEFHWEINKKIPV
ncbi:hypothetical protein A0128_04365 [Leptospira tipperaryensis]|uniref:Uncharacterized protein n=1 Tax=Leptospira tipperaryensis TaxID=2564040 RepID=A0A1D7UUC5_9LEPT|nr:hypothetical protein A0128_04365 [Leptospira tipperaryensis]